MDRRGFIYGVGALAATAGASRGVGNYRRCAGSRRGKDACGGVRDGGRRARVGGRYADDPEYAAVDVGFIPHSALKTQLGVQDTRVLEPAAACRAWNAGRRQPRCRAGATT